MHEKRLFTILILLITISQYCFSNYTNYAANTNYENVSNDEPDYYLYSEDYKLGERLFHGLIQTAGTVIDCASCHNTSHIDTLNWNPSAYDIAKLYRDKTRQEFADALLSPVSTKLTEVHDGFQFSDDEIRLLHDYLNSFAIKGLAEKKPVITNLFLFISSIILALLITMDLIFFKKIRYKFIHIIVLLLLGLFQVNVIVQEAIALGRSEGYAPDQPIKFSHFVHVHENQIDCRYCHNLVDHSTAAGIPSANLCMNCHVLVREGSRSGRFEINKISEAIDNDMPIEWIKVHNLPHHVFFSHAQHVNVGQIDCNECHGNVEDMHIVHQVFDLSMGWCIDCHRTKEVQFFDNPFYEKYEQLYEDFKSGKINKITVEHVGGLDCMKCHY